MCNKFIYYLLLLCLCSVMIEAQEIKVTDNSSVRVKVSSKEPTRISVVGDRIATLRGADGAYTYTNDNTQGAIYIKPTVAYQNSPFYLFISTEQNHNYVLVMDPKPGFSASMLVLKPKNTGSTAETHLETSAPYTEFLTKLMSSMATLHEVEGYDISYVKDAKITRLGYQLTLTLKALYEGPHLKGEIYEVKNDSINTVSLAERAFYQPEDRAIAVRDYTIPAGGKTLLYKVVSNGE